MSSRHAPRVTMAINNFNYAQYLGTAIDSALHHTHHPHEGLVVDDLSTDGPVMASYGDVRRVR